MGACLTPWFRCKHTITIAAKPHQKSACQLQLPLGSVISIDAVLAQYTLFNIVNRRALVADAVRYTVGPQREW